eukprot:Seg1972.9 transcript_id=Seg1972.9/GoldUCD/mRNA.D3Y31 product="Lamin-B receptor" protein_id=Seg1972.9/GoldUCD/D3Y31
MPRKTLHALGKEVFAKWPGTQMYYPAKIVTDHNPENDSYQVLFEDTAEPLEVLAKHISSVNQAKNWRSRSASPARTPGRSKRRRSRSKSPSRTSRRKSPARQRSPGRKPAARIQKEPSPEKPAEMEVQQQQQTEQVKQVDVVDFAQVIQQEQQVTKETLNVIKEERSDATITTRRITRSVARMHDNVGEIMTQEISQEEKREEETHKPGWSCQLLALIAIIVLPLVIMALCFVCGDKHQAFSFTKWPKIPSLYTFLNWKVFLAVGVWFDVQCLLTKLPLGRLVTGPANKDGEQITYRMNGLILLVMNIIVLGIQTYTGLAFKLADAVDKYYLSIAASCIIVAFVVAVIAAILAALDPKVKDKSCTPDSFFVGKQLCPTFLTFDLKWVCFKACFISWVMLVCVFWLKHYSVTKGNINYAATAVAFFQLFYMCDVFLIEKNLIQSHAFLEQTFGFGFSLMAFALTPLLYSMQVMYLIRFTPQLSKAHWAAVILLYVLGTYIFHKANNEKAEFRSDPKKAMKRDVKVVFTANGKNLLADGWWGRLRHPNYLGDILIATSWAVPAGCSHLLPWLYPILLTMLLYGMSKDDEKRCAKKYGLSWDEYKARVKYVMIPYVY